MKQYKTTQIAFYSPGKNHYHGAVTLWFIAKVSTTAGRPWLETQWVCRGEGDIPRLALYVSRLDAKIQAMTLSHHSDMQWRVYPFADLDIDGMMKVLYKKANACLGISIVFGFSSSDAGAVFSAGHFFRTVGSSCDIPLNRETITAESTLIYFNGAIFSFIATGWVSVYGDYIDKLSEINELDDDALILLAREAIRLAKTVVADEYDGLVQYVSTFHIEKQSWLVTSGFNTLH